MIDRFTTVVGRSIRWLSLFMVILICAVVVMRYFLGLPSVVLQESVLYLHATLFMLVIAFCIFLFAMSWRYVSNSWAILERSDETGGLPFVYLLKSLILVMPVLMLLQSIAEFIKTLKPTADTERQ